MLKVKTKFPPLKGITLDKILEKRNPGEEEGSAGERQGRSAMHKTSSSLPFQLL